jgi:hypothetical protein
VSAERGRPARPMPALASPADRGRAGAARLRVALILQRLVRQVCRPLLMNDSKANTVRQYMRRLVTHFSHRYDRSVRWLSRSYS